MEEPLSKDQLRTELLKILARHTSPAHTISMVRLHKEIFKTRPKDKINHTRRLRKLIEELRWEGVAIAAVMDATDGGFFLATLPGDVKKYIDGVKKQAVKRLAMAAKVGKITLPEMLNEVQLELEPAA